MAHNSHCYICELSTSTENLLLETDYWRVVLAADQAYLGRSYVVLRDHKESLSVLSRDEWQDFEALVVRIESGYEKALGSGRPFNWSCLMNNAFQEADPTPHVHWHLRPRHGAPITIHGAQFEDPEFGFHYSRDHTQLVDQAILDEIASKIKRQIQTSPAIE